jgi:hypothetical protein
LRKETQTYRYLFKPSEELHNLYASPNFIGVIRLREMIRAGHVACMGEMRNACKMLVRKPEGKRPLGRPRRRWEDNIRMMLGKWGGKV